MFEQATDFLFAELGRFDMTAAFPVLRSSSMPDEEAHLEAIVDAASGDDFGVKSSQRCLVLSELLKKR